MKELQDLLDMLPVGFLFILLPVFIVLSPVNPVAAATHEFPVHRMTHMDVAGTAVGSKVAAVSMEARALGAKHFLRKVVVSRLQDLSAAAYSDLASGNAGAVLLLVPPSNASLSGAERESVQALEEHLLTAETELPVFLAQETAELNEFLEVLRNDAEGTEASSSAAKALWSGITSYGYQLVSSTTTSPAKPLADQSIVNVQGTLVSSGADDDSTPTIIVVAHYDAAGMAPSMAVGADSNGSGVTILMELARIFGSLYSSRESQPPVKLVFLATGGGKMNYFGSKKWLEDQRDVSEGSEFTSNVQYVVCLDSLGHSKKINMHVSKPPKEGSPAHKFFNDLKKMASVLYPEDTPSVEMVHKKINLAFESLAWEHERYSINKLSAFSLSRFDAAFAPERSSILDRQVNEQVVLRNTRIIAEALACSVFSLSEGQCLGQVFQASRLPHAQSVRAWTAQMAAAPRGAGVVAGANSAVVQQLSAAMQLYTQNAKQIVARRDKREPEYTFYDSQDAVMTAYKVKPAVFDLVLTMCIAGYLGLVYLALLKSHLVYSFFLSLASSSSVAQKAKPETNGTSHKSKVH